MLGRKSPPTKEPFIPRDSRPDFYRDGADQATDGRGAGSILAKQQDRALQQPDRELVKPIDREPDKEPGKPIDREPDKPIDREPDKEPDKPIDKEPDKPIDKEPDKEPDKPIDKEPDGPQPGKRQGEPGMIGLIEELMRPGSGSSRS